MPRQPVKDKDYRVEKWGQYDNFCCLHCQYATIYWEIYVEKHFLQESKHKHKWAFPKPVDENTPQGIVKDGPIY